MSHQFLIVLVQMFQGTKVILNVYDLSPANDVLYRYGVVIHRDYIIILLYISS